MPEVSWDATYDIDIKHMSANTVHHLHEALKKYLEGDMHTGDNEVISTFVEIMEISKTITATDERD